MSDKSVCSAVAGLKLDPTLQAYLRTTENEGGKEVLLSQGEVKAYLQSLEILPANKIKNLKALIAADESSSTCGVFGKQARKFLTGNGFVIPKEARALGFDTVYVPSYGSFAIMIPCGKVFTPIVDRANPRPSPFERVEWNAKRNTLVVESKDELVEYRCDFNKNEITQVEFDKKTKKEKTKETLPYFRVNAHRDTNERLTKSDVAGAKFSAADLREEFNVPDWLEIREVKNANGVVGIILRSKDGRSIGRMLNVGETSEVLLERDEHTAGPWELADRVQGTNLWEAFKSMRDAINFAIRLGTAEEARKNPVNIKINGKIVKAFRSADHEGKYLFLTRMDNQLIYDPATKKMSLGLGWEYGPNEKATLKHENGVLSVEVDYFNLRGEVINTAEWKIVWLDDNNDSFIGEVVR